MAGKTQQEAFLPIALQTANSNKQLRFLLKTEASGQFYRNANVYLMRERKKLIRNGIVAIGGNIRI